MTNKCKWVTTCQPKTIDCNNKCGRWDRGCGQTKDCGGCNNNQNCVSGVCKPKPPSCNPKTCAQLGIDGTKGSACGKQVDNGCGDPITCSSDCNGGLSCTGRNHNGYGGKCTTTNNPNPTNPPSGPTRTPTQPPSNNINVVVFYDKYTKNSQKGVEPSYNVCYPSANTTNKPPASPSSANVSVTVNSGDTGVPTTTYTNKSYTNCKSNGGNSSSRGFTIKRSDNSKSVKLNVPSGYVATGYNYTVDGKANVRCITGSTAKGCSGTANATPYLQGQDITVRFGIVKGTPPSTQVTGFVFVDDNGNDQYEPGDDGNSEVCFDSSQNQDVTINHGGSNSNFTQKTSCNQFTYTNSGATKLNSIPTGYKATGFEYKDDSGSCAAGDGSPDPDTGWCLHDSASSDTQESVTLSGDSEVHFGIKQVAQTYTVSGNIFNDSPPLGVKSGSDFNYTTAGQPRDVSAYSVDDSGNVAASPTVTSTNASGGYTLPGLTAGTYQIEYYSPANGSGPPSGYSETYPNVVAPPPTFTVSVGNSDCWIQKSGQTTLKDASCSAGNITGLNFGISNAAQAWFQTVGGDMRIDSDLTDPIPSTATVPYASTNIASPVVDPGILFTANPSASLTSGTNQSARASSKGWLSVSNPYKSISGGTRLSFTYLTSIITRGGQFPSTGMYSDNVTTCGTNASHPNCQLAANLPSGIYNSSTGYDVKITNANYSFAAGRNYIFLIGGNLEIAGNLTVPATSTVIFAASGDITVDPNVTQLDGIYSTEGKFDTGACTGTAATCALQINGSVIANAAGEVSYNTVSTVFNNGRSLTTNSTTPSVTFNLRTDFLVNLPETLKVPNYVIQEVAPGPAFSFGTSQGSVTPTPSPTPTPVPPPPSTPVATAATGITSSGFAANWNAAANATGYKLDVSTSNTFSTYVSGFQNLDVGNVLTKAVGSLAANTTYYYRVRSYNAVGTSANSNIISVTTSPATVLRYQVASGELAIEPESHTLNGQNNQASNTPGNGGANGTHSWANVTDAAASNGIYLFTTNDGTVNSPGGTPPHTAHVSYNIHIGTQDTFNVWVRGWSRGSASDTVYIGVDGALLQPMALGTNGAWKWDHWYGANNNEVRTTLSAGNHTIDVWEGDDGYQLDKIVLTSNLSKQMSDSNDPAESPFQ